jgi:hypothetical protein
VASREHLQDVVGLQNLKMLVNIPQVDDIEDRGSMMVDIVDMII